MLYVDSFVRLFLLGTDIMGAPVMQEYSSTVDVLFPGDTSLRWYRVDLDTVTVHNGGATETVDAPTDTVSFKCIVLF